MCLGGICFFSIPPLLLEFPPSSSSFLFLSLMAFLSFFTLAFHFSSALWFGFPRGVGGIEAEAVMLGECVSAVLPEVVGLELVGRLPAGSTSTDLVLTVTALLRHEGVVGKFVEFFGEGLDQLAVADRATISNMAPEYGATMGFFPVDAQTIEYLKLTGRDQQKCKLVEDYCKLQGLYRWSKLELENQKQQTIKFALKQCQYSTPPLRLDLMSVRPCVAGPKRPHDRVDLFEIADDFARCLSSPLGFKGFGLSPASSSAAASFPFVFRGHPYTLSHGSVVISALTSCTNTSNPLVMLCAGLLAQSALARGLRIAPFIKTSLSPGSPVVKEYLVNSGLLDCLERLGFFITGFGCQTCIGNSGDLDDEVQQAVDESKLVVASVLSGNRNFEGRVHPATAANYLASPPLCVAFAIAGTVCINFQTTPLGKDAEGNNVFLADVWPTGEEVQKCLLECVQPKLFKDVYCQLETSNKKWNELEIPEGSLYAWDPKSTYIKSPPFFSSMTSSLPPPEALTSLRCLLLLGDSITTDHISPAGRIARASPAAQYLQAAGVVPRDFNSFGARRGNDEVMVRGTFSNVRIQNKMVQHVGPFAMHVPTQTTDHVFNVAQKYSSSASSVPGPFIVIAGRDYGSGSSRDWAAKGPYLLGVRAVVAVSYERIHRSNLVGMAILPLEFTNDQDAASLKLTGRELFTISNAESHGQELKQFEFTVGQTLFVHAETPKEEDAQETRTPKVFKCKLRIDTQVELDYYRNGGILPFVLRKLLGNGKQ
eukprot:GHVT01102690.1.p1 GENE.GHVT01102690.1~~GHVT01102690.1.p1  ORF type:complete len:767 (+),score=165.61 GHVT01102690.1:809-3109(+)